MLFRRQMVPQAGEAMPDLLANLADFRNRIALRLGIRKVVAILREVGWIQVVEPQRMIGPVEIGDGSLGDRQEPREEARAAVKLAQF